MPKTARERLKKARREEARERLWENLTKGRSGIPRSGIPSDWSILTDFVNTLALLTQIRSREMCDMAAVRDLSRSNAMFKCSNKLDDHGGLSSSEQLNTIGVAETAMRID